MIFINAILNFYSVKEITKENVNNTFRGSGKRIIDYAVVYDDLYEKYIPWLLSLGATVNATTLYTADQNHVKFILEEGLDVRTVCFETAVTHFQKEDNIFLLVDWGVTVPSKFIIFDNDLEGPNELRAYASLSNARVQECRKYLLALLWYCKLSNLHPLWGVILQMATQVWRLKGSEGVGPRGHEWVLK